MNIRGFPARAVDIRTQSGHAVPDHHPPAFADVQHLFYLVDV
jgi:hypothetical protein